MGDAMEEGTLLKWLKSEGDSFEEDEEIFEVETEKSTIAVPAPEAGVLGKIMVQAGETVAVGTPIGRYSTGDGDEEEEAAAASPEESEESAAGSPEESEENAARAETAEQESPTTRQSRPAPAPAAESQARPAPSPGGRVKASPLAKKRAAEHGLDLGAVAGTGPGGRIVDADVEDAIRRPGAAAPAPSAPAPRGEGDQVKRLSPMRKVIARRLTQSKQTIPHFYMTMDVDMRRSVALRSDFNEAVTEDRRISFNDLVIRAAALALQEFPNLYSFLDGEEIRTPPSINIGVAVSLEEGLVVPVLRDVASSSVSQIGQEVRRLAGVARGQGLKPEDYSGGAFTISNLGMYDITQFQAVINPPEAAILAIGAIRDTPIVEDGAVVPGKQMYLTISVDHRLVDGHVAAQFMQRMRALLEQPVALLG